MHFPVTSNGALTTGLEADAAVFVLPFQGFCVSDDVQKRAGSRGDALELRFGPGSASSAVFEDGAAKVDTSAATLGSARAKNE